ncbi:MAG: hypothetical protein ACI8YQ_000641 [Polaribacter sp.]|jgi:hypothetical protein
MKLKKLIVKTSSERFWWGVYGLMFKNGYEDIDVYDETGALIDRIHLRAKGYLRAGLRFLKDDAKQLDYAIAIEKYLEDDQYYFWYYYDEVGDNDLFEVDYNAPRNKDGVRPKSIEIWNPEEGIGASTIKDCVKEFARRFLMINDCEIELDSIRTIDESIESFRVNQELNSKEASIKINLSPALIYELSKLWNKSENEVKARLNDLNE